MHMTFARRFFCVVLFVAAALFSFSAASGNAFAAVWDGSVASSFDGGTGTQADPYRIANGAQLARLGAVDTGGEYFVLTDDIDLGNLNWTPIEGFSGNLNGAGFTVSNLNINETDKTEIGFFRRLYGSVQNLNLNGSVTGIGFDIGMLAGASGGDISNCMTSGSVSGAHPHKDIVSGSGSSGSSMSSIGGMVGSAGTNMDSCYTDCTVTGSEEGKILFVEEYFDEYGNPVIESYPYALNLGGLAGELSGGVIKNSASAAVVRVSTPSSEVDNGAGVLVDWALRGATLSNNAAYGAATAIGGLPVAGSLLAFGGEASRVDHSLNVISNNMSVGAASVQNTTFFGVGGVIGAYLSDGSTLSNNLYDSQGTGQIYAAGRAGPFEEGVLMPPTTDTTGTRTTAQLISGSDPGSLGSEWTFTAGYYPRPTALVNSPNPSIQKAVALGAVPLNLADGDTVANITKSFTVPTTTADGSPITWSSSSPSLTVDSSGNVTVSGAVVGELTAEANGFKKTFVLGGGSGTDPVDPTDPDGPTPPPLPANPAKVTITNPDAQSQFDTTNGRLANSGVHIELGNNQSPIDAAGTAWQLIDSIDNIAISVVDPSVIIPPDCYETLGKSGADIGIDVGGITSPGRSAIMPIMYSVTLSRSELDSLFGAAAANIVSKPYANLDRIFSRLVIQKEIIEGSETNMYANLVPNILKPADAVTKGIMRLYTNSGGLEIELSCYVLDAEYRNPYLHRDASGGEYLVIHDGAANGKISDPFWLHRYTGTSDNDSGGGGGGCNTGMFSLALLLAACKVRRRNR